MSQAGASTFVRFIKFGIVGGSGVLVNLAVLTFLASVCGFGASFAGKALAGAIAVEVSICTNFIFNDIWTFSDRREHSGWVHRLFKFHAVSFGGALIQLGVYNGINLYLELTASTVVGQHNVLGLDVDFDLMLAQCLGIGLGMAWNFFANFLWTWKETS